MPTQYTASRNAQLSQLDLVLHRALLWRNQPRYILWITTLLCAVVPRAPFIHLQGWQLSNKNTSTGNKLILSILFSFQMYEILNWGTDQIRGIDLEWPQWICNPWAEPAYLGFCKYLVELRFFRIFKLAQSQHIFSMGLLWSPAEVLLWNIVVKAQKTRELSAFVKVTALTPSGKWSSRPANSNF